MSGSLCSEIWRVPFASMLMLVITPCALNGVCNNVEDKFCSCFHWPSGLYAYSDTGGTGWSTSCLPSSLVIRKPPGGGLFNASAARRVSWAKKEEVAVLTSSLSVCALTGRSSTFMPFNVPDFARLTNVAQLSALPRLTSAFFSRTQSSLVLQSV